MNFKNPFKNRIQIIFIPNVLIMIAILTLISIDGIRSSSSYTPFFSTPWIQALVGISLILSAVESYLRGKMSKLAFWGFIALIIFLASSLVLIP